MHIPLGGSGEAVGGVLVGGASVGSSPPVWSPGGLAGGGAGVLVGLTGGGAGVPVGSGALVAVAVTPGGDAVGDTTSGSAGNALPCTIVS